MDRGVDTLVFQLVFAVMSRFSRGKAAGQLVARRTTLAAGTMGKNNIVPDKGSSRDSWRDLLTAIGKADSPYELMSLQGELEEIKRHWWEREVTDLGPYRKILSRYRANTARRRELRKQFPPSLREEIVFAAYLRANPNGDERELRQILPDDVKSRDPVAEIEEDEDLNIEYLIKSMGDYRKRQVRKLLVEPFLLILEKYQVSLSSKSLPFIHMIRALFDWVGIEQRLRPTDAGIRTIAREFRKRKHRD